MSPVALRVEEGGASGSLLERADELALLVDSLAEVESSSRGQLLLVGGEAGVGKTTLLQRFCDRLGRDVRVLWGACDPLFTPRPFGPLLAVASEVGGELEAAVESGAMPYDVAPALADELRARMPTVFVLEDVHWADEATLDVLLLIARRPESIPALVIATYRDDELDKTHPLRLVLGELAASRSAARIRLAGLSPAAVAQIAKPYAVDPDELYRKTAGNPFFVAEALAAGVEGIPDTVRDAVLARAARLGGAARTVLEAVAVVPPHTELWLLEALAGPALDALEECLTSGMLGFDGASVSFRHELARLAVEESVSPHRRVELHRRALTALAEPPAGEPDLARLAHHAEAAGDVDAILRFAPAAGARAAALGSYREAAAQYARALRFGDRLAPAERADLLERRSYACYLTDQSDEAVAASEEALECRRGLGQRLEEGYVLRWLSEILWCPGRVAEADQAGREAIELLEALPPGRELGGAYASLAQVRSAAALKEDAVSLAGRALELAERFGDTATAAHALGTIGINRWADDGPETLERSLALAQSAGLDEETARSYILLLAVAVGSRRPDVGMPYVEACLAHCTDRGLERDRRYVLAYRGQLELYAGRWDDAAASAEAVLRVPLTSITPRITALMVLGLIRARRGDPTYAELLAEAWSLGAPTRELPRLGSVAAARAEAAWLAGDRAAVDEATREALPLAIERGWGSLVGELLDWRRRAGLDPGEPAVTDEPYTSQLAGDWARAAELWTQMGCPYEAALALADADEEEPLRRSLEELQRLEARPAAAIVARRLRKRGARGLPRGPRPATRRNPAGLTAREAEVLALVADGLRNSEIAARLVLSERTVDHHVGAILRKLGARTRAEASVEAVRFGLVTDLG